MKDICKHLKQTALLFCILVSVTGCLSPYIDLYKEKFAEAKKMEEDRKNFEAKIQKQREEKLAQEEKALSTTPTTEIEVRKKEKILKSRLDNDPKYQRNSAEYKAEDKRISNEADEERRQLLRKEIQAMIDALSKDTNGNQSSGVDPVATLFERATTRLKDKDNIVIVVFAAKTDVQHAFDDIANAMYTNNEQHFSPHWVVVSPGHAINPHSRCAAIVAKWYKPWFDGRERWERIVDRVLYKNSIAGTYLYSRKGEFVLTETGQSQMDLLEAICFAESKQVLNDFNTLDALYGLGVNDMKRGLHIPVTTYNIASASLINKHTDQQWNTLSQLKDGILTGNACKQKLGMEIDISDQHLNNTSGPNDPCSTMYSQYWQEIAEAYGKINAYYYLGQLYEYQAQHSPQGYKIARKNYLTGANKYDDAKAQAALARMYAKGLGVPIDVDQANKWRTQALKTRQAAAKACASPKLETAINRYSKNLYNLSKKMGQADDVGEISISRVTAEQVISLNEPFICLAKGGLNYANVKKGTDECGSKIVTDRYGNQTEEEDCTAATISSIYSSLVNSNMMEVTHKLPVELKSQGHGLYKVSHREGSEIISETLDLN